MALHRGSRPRPASVERTSNALLTEANPAFGSLVAPPHNRLADDPVPADVAYQLIHDELLLDGSARLNLATFVTTWMEPQAPQLMAECVDKNMIDKDEYPQTAELERRCVAILADLWHAPDPGRRHRLLDHRLQRGVHARRAWRSSAAGRPRTGGGPRAPAQPGDGRERAGVLGEVLPLLGRRAAARCRWRASASTSTPASAVAALRREHDRRGGDPGLDLRRQLRAGRRDRRGAGRAAQPAAARTSRCTSTVRPAG